MLVERAGASRSAYVVVLGNEKGGSGKSTVAMHVAVALMKAGQRVATIDLDSRQKSFTHYIENRARLGEACRGSISKLPAHYCIARAEGPRVVDNEVAEFTGFAAGDRLRSSTPTISWWSIRPAHDSYLMRLAHSMADTLITPLNDSFVDFDVLGTVDPATFAVTGTSHFAEMVREARRQRRVVDHAHHGLDRGAQPAVHAGLAQQAAGRARDCRSFRCGSASARWTGFAERVIFREFYPRGLTALDDLDEATLGTRPSMSHVTARQEVESLLTSLKLPFDERGLRRAAARAEWFATADQPLELHDILGRSE